ncbi:MAG: 50S ribosomal protein L32 [bacterium]
MAVPKQRTSGSKRRSRFARWKKMEKPNLNKCGNCGSSKRPHRVCMECGFYKGRQVIDVG